MSSHHMLLVTLLLLFSCEKQQHLTSDAEQQEITHSRQSKTSLARSQSSNGMRAEVHDADDKQQKILAAAWQEAEGNPALAWQQGAAIAEKSDERKRLLEHCAVRMAEQDIDASLAWARGLLSLEDRRIALAKIAIVMAAANPMVAVAVLSEEELQGHEREVALVQVMQLWAQKSGPEAAAYALSWPASPLKQAGLQAVTAQWLHSDAAAYGLWLRKLESVETQELMRDACAEILTQMTPEQRQQIYALWPPELQRQVEARMHRDQ